MERPKPQEWLEKDKLILLQGWARDGLTDEQIAHNMGVSVRTLYRWKALNDTVDEKTGETYLFSQIRQALKTGKESVDYAVENALLKAALGGNVTAMIYWLKNRKPSKWRDRREATVGEETMALAEDILVSIKEVAGVPEQGYIDVVDSDGVDDVIN